MSDLLDRLRRTVADLTELGYESALVGGFAVGFQVRPRVTKDIDLAVAVSGDRDAESLVRGLHGMGYQVVQLLEQTGVERLSTVRVRLPHSESATPEVDILFASSGIEPEIVSQAVVFDCEGVGPVRVARVGHLIAMKVLSETDAREQDRADLRALLQTASAVELDAARTAVQLIGQRGFNRDRDVQASLEELVRRHLEEQERGDD